MLRSKYNAQLAFTCSKLTRETLEQGVNMLTIKTLERRQWRHSGGVVLVSLLLTLNIYHTLF